MKIGDLVRFNHSKDGGPVHRVTAAGDGMVELHDMLGWFSASMFTSADDIGGIPLDGKTPPKTRPLPAHCAAPTRRVSAGPYTLELPSNGVAILSQADEGGTEHQLPGGADYLDALVQFAGEIIRLQALLDRRLEP